MNRRNLLKSLLTGGTLAAVTAVPTDAAEDPDVVPYRSWILYWSGWRMPCNQDVLVGWWCVFCQPDPTHGYDRIVATTGGLIDPHRPLNVYNMTIKDGWGPITIRSSQSERWALKRRTREALQDFIARNQARYGKIYGTLGE